MNEEWLIQASHKRILLHKKCRFINLVDAKLVALKACRNSISVDFSHHTHGWRRRKFTEGTEGINVQCEISAMCHRQNTVMKKKNRQVEVIGRGPLKIVHFGHLCLAPPSGLCLFFAPYEKGGKMGWLWKGWGGCPVTLATIMRALHGKSNLPRHSVTHLRFMCFGWCVLATLLTQRRTSS